MSNVLLDAHNKTIEKCEFNDLFTVSANIQKKVNSIEINENFSTIKKSSFKCQMFY